MANASRLGSALLSVKGTLATFPEFLEHASRGDHDNPHTIINIASDVRHFFKHVDVHAKVVSAELRQYKQLIERSGVPAARQFAAATSVLRVFHDTGILPSVQELCEDISRVCSSFPRHPVTSRLAILSFVQISSQWIAGALTHTRSHVDFTLNALALGTHGQTELQPSHYDLPMQTVQGLSSPPLLKALLGLFPAVRATLDQEVADVQSLPRRSSPMEMYAQYGKLLFACAKITEFLTQDLATRVQRHMDSCSTRPQPAGAAGGSVGVRQGSDSSEAAAAQVRYLTWRVDALHEAGWLPGLCAAVVDMPHPGRLCKRQRDRDAEGSSLEEAMINAHDACASIVEVMAYLFMLACARLGSRPRTRKQLRHPHYPHLYRPRKHQHHPNHQHSH